MRKEADFINSLSNCVEILEGEVNELEEENKRLRAQLPEGMKHCTILAKECALGHAWLTATNWIQHGCPTCEKNALVKENEKLKEAGLRMAEINTKHYDAAVDSQFENIQLKTQIDALEVELDQAGARLEVHQQAAELRTLLLESTGDVKEIVSMLKKLLETKNPASAGF